MTSEKIQCRNCWIYHAGEKGCTQCDDGYMTTEQYNKFWSSFYRELKDEFAESKTCAGAP